MEVESAGSRVTAAIGGEEGEDVRWAKDDVVEEQDLVVRSAFGLLSEEWLDRKVSQLGEVRDTADLFAFCPAWREDPALSRMA